MWHADAELPASRHICALLVLWIALMASGAASALSFDLDREFDTGVMGPYSTIEIVEDAGALDFLISLNLDALGPDADLHVLYFNFVGDATGLAISGTDAPSPEYVLMADPSVAGGAGSSFDWGVHFGNGAGVMGNRKLQSARFTLSAHDGLVIENLLGSSWAAGNSIEVHMAAHIQGTSALTGASSETIGGVVPEPSTAILLMSGLGVLTWRKQTARLWTIER